MRRSEIHLLISTIRDLSHPLIPHIYLLLFYSPLFYFLLFYFLLFYFQCVADISFPPNPHLQFFCRELKESLRVRVASCIQKSHTAISTSRAKQLLMFDDNRELISFVEDMNRTKDHPMDDNILQEGSKIDDHYDSDLNSYYHNLSYYVLCVIKISSLLTNSSQYYSYSSLPMD